MIIEIALGIVLGVLILKNLDAIFALGAVAIGGAIALALLAVAGVGLYLGWEWIASHERGLVGVTVLAAILLGSMVTNWIGKRTGLDGGDIFVGAAMLLMLISATAVFSAMIYKWSSDAADPFLYLFLVPIIELWAWFYIKASSHIRKRKKPTATVAVDSVQA